MATLTRKHIYNNGGASYGQAGVKASIYCGPRMFTGPAPETIDFNAENIASPDSASLAKTQEKAEAKQAREQAKADKAAAREAKKVEVAKAREDKKAATAAAREQKKAEAKAKRDAAKSAAATSTMATGSTGDVQPGA